MYASRSRNSKQGLSGSASSILERAKGQLQGRRYGVMTRSAGSLNRNTVNRDPEEDDLNAYLSQLSKKTGKNTKMTQDDEDDGDDDIDLSNLSLSSEEGLDLGVTRSSLNASKFLKKSQSQTLSSKQVLTSSTTLKKSSTTPNFLNKTAPAFTSSALQKAAQLGAKFAKKKAAIAKKLESDSDGELNVQRNVESKSLQGKKVETWDEDDDGGSRFLKKTTKASFYVSDSEDESLKMDAEDTFGRDGNKFMKKPVQNKRDAVKTQDYKDTDERSSDTSLGEVPASRFLKKKPSGLDTFSTSTPVKEVLQAQKTRKEKDKLTRPAAVASSSQLGMSLDSDEEDLRDFIDNLTPTSTPEVPPVREKIDDSSEVSDEEDDGIGKVTSKPAPKRTLTPGPGKQVPVWTPTASGSSSSDDTVGEEAGSSVAESIDEDVGGIRANIMQIEDLLPAAESNRKSAARSKHIEFPREAWSESEPSEAIPSETEEHQTLNLAGLQTVDDLFSHQKSDQSIDGEEKGHGDYKSDFETATEIATQRTEEIPEESIHSGIPSSMRRIEADEMHSSADSIANSITDSSTRTVADAYTSDTRTSSKSRSSRSYSRSYYSRSKTHSGKRSTSEQTQTYSADFQSGTDSELEELPSDDKDTTTVTKSRSYTSYSETTTSTVTPKKGDRKKRRDGMKDASVQADGTVGLLHHWITDSDIRGIESVTQKDPTPVTTHVVNPEALEALTNFSPSLLALNDSLIAQLQYTREAAHNSLRLHRSLVDSIENDYEYITLENTKEFIANHRRPKLTMEQALAMVRQEMEEEDRL